MFKLFSFVGWMGFTELNELEVVRWPGDDWHMSIPWNGMEWKDGSERTMSVWMDGLRARDRLGQVRSGHGHGCSHISAARWLASAARIERLTLPTHRPPYRPIELMDGWMERSISQTLARCQEEGGGKGGVWKAGRACWVSSCESACSETEPHQSKAPLLKGNPATFWDGTTRVGA